MPFLLVVEDRVLVDLPFRADENKIDAASGDDALEAVPSGIRSLAVLVVNQRVRITEWGCRLSLL